MNEQLNEFPIVAHQGVHNTPNKEENYKQLKDCGFNSSYYQFGFIESDEHVGLREACEMAQKNGIALFACTNNLYVNPEEEARKLKDLKGFYGYFIVDEPTEDKMNNWGVFIERIKKVDNTHNIYGNLLPCYDENELDNYKNHLEKSKVMDFTQVSFDFYPICDNEYRKKAWYSNLKDIKEFSEKEGKDWWGFILSVPHYCYPQPTMEHLKVQAYTNLAFGCQGLQYFTYQTPEDYDIYHFYNGPIDKDKETKTTTWYLVRTFNNSLKRLLPIFYKAKNYKTTISKDFLWWNWIEKENLPEGFSELRTTCGEGFVLSEFDNNGKHYVMVVNSSYEKEANLIIKQNGYKVIDKDAVEELQLEQSYRTTLRKGDCEIFVKDN